MSKTKDIPIPTALHTQLKRWCVRNDITLTRATAQAVAMYLATNGATPQEES